MTAAQNRPIWSRRHGRHRLDHLVERRGRSGRRRSGEFAPAPPPASPGHGRDHRRRIGAPPSSPPSAKRRIERRPPRPQPAREVGARRLAQEGVGGEMRAAGVAHRSTNMAAPTTREVADLLAREQAARCRRGGRRPGRPASRPAASSLIICQSPIRIVATAWAAMPSPRPVKPSRSVVVALMLTSAERQPQQRRDPRPHRVPMRADPRRLADDGEVDMRDPAAGLRRPGRAHARRSSDEAAPRHCGSDGGKWSPMSPAPSAPSIASVSAWSATSASLWPARPRSCGISTPPSHSSSPAAKAWTSKPMPTRGRQPGRFGARRNPPRRSACRAPDRLRPATTSRPAARATWASSVASPPVQAAWARADRVEAEGLRRLHAHQLVARAPARRRAGPGCRPPAGRGRRRHGRRARRAAGRSPRPGRKGRAASWISTRSAPPSAAEPVRAPTAAASRRR